VSPASTRYQIDVTEAEPLHLPFHRLPIAFEVFEDQRASAPQVRAHLIIRKNERKDVFRGHGSKRVSK
jgi:hypothetical protein